MRRLALCVAVAIAAMWPAAQAQALVLPSAELHGTNGHRILIEGFGNQVTVTARSEGAGAIYAVTGTVQGDILTADLGPFGGVALQFIPTATPEELGAPGCRGGVVLEKGVWQGTISFVAERGFTSAFASAAQGEVLRLRRRCAKARGQEIEAIAAIHARRKGERGAIFSAFELPGRRSIVSASRGHDEQGVRVVDFVHGRLGPARLRVDPELERAFVDPRAPFTGEARFRRDAGLQRSWSGDLAVEFPAGYTVKLAGPRFQALLGGEEVAIGVASVEGLLGAAF